MLYPKTFGENPLFPQACNFAVVPKDNNSGFGVITFQAYKPGDLLAIVTGEMVSDIRQHTLQVSKRRHMYDPYFTGYLLHSCEPNVSLNMKKMTLTALKEIKKGEFLFMDYAETEDILYRQFGCCCTSESCRGWITGRKEMPQQMILEQHDHHRTH
ncbi:MAG: SET domain-containing protein-lysine N-methyltransferase [Gammaproteobacteria bacterium]|jgi:uncharacterized protein|nr:SET domain-containing protein-lysine N-methyltransferase [Gammaproteobacteria bacterium]MBT6043712.1 SET domain-containing protein-lysine N-methyltransferase [Gammaproteobacteria bacterium]